MEKIIEKINKLSLPAAILIVAVILGGVYFAIGYNKQHFIEKQQKEVKEALNICLVSAENNYSNMWYKECKVQSNLTTKCMDIHELSFDKYLEKYGLTVEDYVRERNLKPADPNDPKSVRIKATIDYIIKARSECSCRLPVSTADRLNENLEKDNAECFKRYPQQ